MTPALSGKGWLELPGAPGNEEYVKTFSYDGERNFSYNYDKDMFTSLWVAYPLYESTLSGKDNSSWDWDPNVPDAYEINVTDGTYKVNLGQVDQTGYDSNKEYYARGHQIPNADRKGSMNQQVYYNTNSTPQIQNGFNGGIWENLESAIRKAIPTSDTLYVVTGAAFQKKGESKSVTWIKPYGESTTNKKAPVPNYYWKVLLKVKRNSGGVVTSASSVGFWYEHKSYSGTGKKYDDSEFVVNVDQIEQWTGFDFFVNVPDAVEAAAETNTSWSDFQSF